MKGTKGVTLILLIIIVILLLILTGVFVGTLTGDNGTIKNAESSIEQAKSGIHQGEQTMNQIVNKLLSDAGDVGSNPKIISVDENGLALKDTIITTSDPNVQIVIPAGFAPVILNGSDWTYSNPGQDGSVKSIMPKNQWNNITAEDINKGVVIVDHAITYDGGNTTGTVPDFNEYVWVSVPTSNDFARVAWQTRYGLNANGAWGDGGTAGRQHILANSSTANSFWEDTNTTEYANMVNSVNTYKGFYISRYEASKGTNNVAQSKRGQTVWETIKQTSAITASMSNSVQNTHLINGVEWDCTLKWLQKTGAKTEAEIQANSNTWGNYKTSVSPANETGFGSKQKTGFSEYWKANNIYDLAGNVGEWTLENYSTGNMRTHRGGACNVVRNALSAADREIDTKDSMSYVLRVPLLFLYNTTTSTIT